MVYADFSSHEIVKALRSKRYGPVGRTGSHVKPRYEHPKTSEVRVVTVPLVDADRISQDTYRSIVEQLQTTSRKGIDWIERNR